jgi:peptide/nickel transport system permease protein
MLRYSLRRALYSALVVLGVLILVFIVVDQIGDPARLMLPTDAPQQVYLDLRARLGLDDPFHERLWRTFSGWFRGDFGESLWQGAPSLSLALERIPYTLLLTVVSLSFAVPIALVVGGRSAVKPGSLGDRVLTTISLACVSVADFWLGLMLILVVSVQFGMLPTSGFHGPLYVILPALTLAFRPFGRIAQVARSALVEEMQKPYVKALRAKGLTEGQIVRGHAMKNAAIPIITISGDEIATFLNGAVVIETLFAWPGIGSLFIGAIERRDLPLIEACVFVVAVMVIVVNLIVDLTYARLDPRTGVRAD